MNSIIFKYYKNMSNKELQRLELFFKSPYFNTSKNQLTLYNLLISDDIVTKQLIKENIFVNKELSDSSYKKLFSNHLNLIKQFFIHEKGKKDELIWLKSLINLDFDTNEILTETNKLRKKIALKKNIVNYNGFLDFELCQFEYSQIIKKEKLSIETLKSKFISKNKALDSYFLFQKLKSICSFYNLQSIFKMNKTIHWQHEIELYMENKTIQYNLTIELYWKIIQIRKDNSRIEIFDEILLDVTSEDFKKIDFEDKKELFEYIIGICIILIVRENQLHLNIALFELYKIAIEYNYLSDHHGYINHRTFKNVIRCALNNNELQWTKAILKNTKKIIDTSSYNDAYHYNYGVYHYFNKEYQKALQSFSNLHYDNLYYSVDLRTFLIKIYFETEEIDLLFSMITSFRAFLKRNNTFSEIMISSFRNFINATKRLSSISKRDQKKLKLLRSKIENQNPIIEKKWILDILNKRIVN